MGGGMPRHHVKTMPFYKGDLSTQGSWYHRGPGTSLQGIWRTDCAWWKRNQHDRMTRLRLCWRILTELKDGSGALRGPNSN